MENGNSAFFASFEGKKPRDLPDYVFDILGRSLWLTIICKEAGIDPASVRQVVELGCGTGTITQALLDTFPETTILAVDRQDVLGSLGRDWRVRFHPTAFTQFLRGADTRKTDLTVMRQIGAYHGIDESVIPYLADCVGQGRLILSGDDGGLRFKDFFSKYFIQTNSLFEDNTTVWKIKSEI